ncbi:MAG: hypothetical protein EAZ15_07860 [Sphingobacteriales bacterium]|nr:MAG: hypothetical protein EAZ15_07860 [Sphingobacteriales bacterium]
MISIIICSRNKTLLNTVSQSVKNTIGVPYEIIAIDNADAKYGICKAYNLGAAQAKYDIFCFMHEDITFETQNWGQNVINHLQDESVGLIGVAGIDPKGIVPAFLDKSIANVEMNIIQSGIENNQTIHLHRTVNPLDTSIIKQVSIIDGVWMCTTRKVYTQFKYDEDTFKGFHCYDIDLALQVNTQFKVGVVFDVLLNHLSMGKIDKKYYDQNFILYHKWKTHLPMSIRKISKNDFSEYHWFSMDYFFREITRYDYTLTFILKYYFIFSLNKYFKLKPFLFLITKIIGKRYFKLKFSN